MFSSPKAQNIPRGVQVKAGLKGKSASLRACLESREISFLMEAHNGISAKIVEEAGFGGIWASGLTISASLGVRDNNEASWTQVVDVIEFMNDATSLPILMDGDTGYGNFNNARRLVRKLSQRQIAGVCIEDKLFPKTNSFIGERQPLADVEEFCGRIKAGKDSQLDDDFVIVARTEALISGYDVSEALRRARAYEDAGADAILVHSKLATAIEVVEFAKYWDGKCPLVIVPTTYYNTPIHEFEKAGISTIIWANHNLRASVSAMRETSQKIFQAQSLSYTEGEISSVQEIFRLTDSAEFEAAERQYLPGQSSTRAVVLATAADDTEGTSKNLPACMAKINGQSVLTHQVSALTSCEIHSVNVVRGGCKEKVFAGGVSIVDNEEYATTGEAFSLRCGLQGLDEEVIVVARTVVFQPCVLESLMAAEGDIVLAVDVSRIPVGAAENSRDFVKTARPYSASSVDKGPIHITEVLRATSVAERSGEWIGLARFSSRGARWLNKELYLMSIEKTLEAASLPQLLTRLSEKYPVIAHHVQGQWIDVNEVDDSDFMKA